MNKNKRESIKDTIRQGLIFAIEGAMEDATVYVTENEQEDGTYEEVYNKLLVEVLNELLDSSRKQTKES